MDQKTSTKEIKQPKYEESETSYKFTKHACNADLINKRRLKGKILENHQKNNKDHRKLCKMTGFYWFVYAFKDFCLRRAYFLLKQTAPTLKHTNMCGILYLNRAYLNRARKKGIPYLNRAYLNWRRIVCKPTVFACWKDQGFF